MNPTAPALSVLDRLKIDAELTKLARERAAMSPGASMFAFKLAQLASKIVALLTRRGADLRAPVREREAFATEGAPDVPEQPKASTEQFYDFDPNRKHGERKKDNAAAMALLRSIDAGEINGATLSDEQKAALAKYSGTGGNLTGADGKEGSAYEYYTPKPIAEAMWGLLGELGFKGGKTLDPCSGVGIFGATSPANVAMESVELNETSGRINQLVNGGPAYNAVISPFEAVASRTGEELYDAVISNVPFGGVHDRGSNRKLDERYQDEPLETYFILRSLEKLRPGGLAAFITPPRVVSGKGGREEQLRMRASYVAEFMGAYRLPNSVFGTADADTITDVIVFRKFGRDAAQKIDELRAQNPGALIEANVLWQEFIDGKYFQGEGHRYVLGQFQAKDPSKFRDVDRVISDQSVGNIAKLLHKFHGSRIDWKAIEAAESEPIAYNEGDSITLAGQTLQMREGRWVSVGKSADTSRFDAVGPLLASALTAASNRVDWQQTADYVADLSARSLDLEMPQWLRFATNDMQRAEAAERPRLWLALIAGLATNEAMARHGGEAGFNYQDEYAVLSDLLVDTTATAQKAPAKFSREGKAAFAKARIIFTPKTGFAPIWTGAGAADVDMGTLGTEQKIGALQYRAGSAIDVADLKTAYGEHFDVMADDDWCLSADGTTATRADDYYSGNLAEFLARLDKEIATADGVLQQKLLRQRDAAAARVDIVDPTELRFNLFSPFVTIEEKCEFMRRFMNPAFNVGVNNLGAQYIVYEGPSGANATIEQNLMSRIASYLSGDAGGRGVRSLTLQGKDLGISDREALEMMRKYATRLNTQFDGWVRANKAVMNRLAVTANDPARLYFNEIDDNSPLDVPGLKPDRVPHGYQNAFVRKQARNFGGINGFDVGLGKSLTALIVAQYVQSIGVKKKTAFVVPNSVMSNWRREVAMTFESMDDCLFVGFDFNEKTGEASVNSANYARDFTRVLENRHRKIFCTLEAFSSIPMREETIGRYESYLFEVDPSYAGDSNKKADSERASSKLSDVTGSAGMKSTALPFFEDMGIDSLVCDEGHMFKNSKDTLDFSGAKFLSVAEASQRGRDMQMKAWFVRGLSDRGDGVLPLTATPITNSPLEIYSMLTLAVGEKKVHDLFMGIKGADAFMDAMCVIEDDEDEGIDGTVKSYRIFKGLQNVNMLRGAISAIATIKTAKDVKAAGDDLRLPEAPENQARVRLPSETLERLNEYKMAYRAAKELSGMAAKSAEPVTPEEIEAFERVQARFGEDAALIAHPFNLIQKMTALIADPELDERATFYTILASQAPAAEKVIAAFNKLGKVEQRSRTGPWTQPEAVAGKVTVKEGGDESIRLKIKVQAGITPDGRVWVDTTDYAMQLEFEKIADKAGLELDCNIPPKLAALLENVKKEEATPRSKSGRVKQLIFCDILPMHNKIKRILAKHAGIASSAIEIISGRSIKNPEQMQDIQDGFNAEGNENRYRTIIANEKAEVGINLQKGTQAIHHLTIGWTPDSQHQRNGRGVRQGNTTALVNIYHYDADGTFDRYKRTLTTKKADWISGVMDAQGGNEVQVAGGLSSKQYDQMIESMGDDSKIQAIEDRAALDERMQRAENARERQMISLQTAMSQQKFAKDFPQVTDWLGHQAEELFDLNEQIKAMEKRKTDKMKPGALMRFEEAKSDLRAKMASLVRALDEAANYSKSYNGSFADSIADMLNDATYTVTSKRREVFAQKAKYTKAIKPESTLKSDWEEQVSQSKAMEVEAFKQFERIGGTEDGAHSPRVVEAFRSGNGVLIDGAPYVPGMLMRWEDGALLILEERHGTLYAVRFPDMAVRLTDALKHCKTIPFDTPEYDAAVTEAAKLDDAIESVPDYQEHMLFSAMSADVATRRRKETLVRRSGMYLVLPSPHFKYAVQPTDIEQASEPIKEIVRDQATVITRWEGSTALVSSTANVSKEDDAYGGITRIKPLVEYARAKGVRLTQEDVAIVLNGVARDVSNAMIYAQCEFNWPKNAKARLGEADSVEAMAAIERELIGEAADFMVPDAEWTIGKMCRDYDLKAFANGLKTRLVAAARYRETAAAGGGLAGATTWENPRNGQKRIYFKDVPGAAGAGVYAYRSYTGDIDIGTDTWSGSDDARRDVIAYVFAMLHSDASGEDFDTLYERLKPKEEELPAAEGVDSGADPDGKTIAGVPVSVKGKIGLNGQTMQRVASGGISKPVKDFIKAASEEAGIKAKWRGDQLQWDIAPEAWELMCVKYPEAAKLVNVVAAVE